MRDCFWCGKQGTHHTPRLQLPICAACFKRNFPTYIMAKFEVKIEKVGAAGSVRKGWTAMKHRFIMPLSFVMGVSKNVVVQIRRLWE